MKEMMTVAEVAEMMGLPRSSILRYARNAILPSRRIGKHYLFHRETVLRILQTPDGPRKEEVVPRG